MKIKVLPQHNEMMLELKKIPAGVTQKIPAQEKGSKLVLRDEGRQETCTSGVSRG